MIRKARTAAPNVKNPVRTLPLLGILLLTLAASSVRAQAPTDNGTPLGLAPGSPEGSYALSGFENVNLYNGGLSFSFPLLQIGGRGAAGYTVQAPIDLRWMVTKNEWYDENNNLFTSLLPSSGAGSPVRGYGPGWVSVRYSQWMPQECNIGSQYFTTYRWATTSVIFTSPDGTEHELVDQATLGRPTNYPYCSLNGNSRGSVFVSRDEPGMTFISDAQISDAPYYGYGRITGFLKLPDGTVYRVDAIDHNFQGGSYYATVISWIRDRNGNKTTFTYTNTGHGDLLSSIKDSLNHEITVEWGVDEAPYGYCDRLTYKGFGGANRVVHVTYASLSTALRAGSAIQTYHQLFPELDGAEDPFDPSLVTAIWLPDNDGVTRRYRFLYNSYGELSRVELPTGGAIEYDWGSGLANGLADGLIYPVPGAAGTELDQGLPQVYRRILARRAYDAGNVLLGSTGYSRPETQNYDHSINNLGYVGVSHMNASGQQLSAENHFFYGSPATSFFSWEATPQYMPTYSPFASYKDGHEYQTDYYAANGQTLLRRVTQAWDQTGVFWWYGSPDTAPPNNPFVKETVTTLADSGQVTKTTNINPQTGQIMIDQFGNPLDTWIYDYGQGQPGALLRHMHTEFMTVNPVNGVDYTNRTSASSPHILNLPTRMSIYDANEIERARTTMEYDNYATDASHAVLVDRLSISGMDLSFNTYYSARGNSTASTRYFLTNGSPTGSITGYVQYDIAGNSVKSIDARGNATTFDFGDRFGAPDGDARANSGSYELNSAGQYSYAFPTSVTNALGHTSYTQFDYYLGKIVDSEDANGTTFSGYYNDALDRPTQVINGANRDASLKSQSLFSYDDVSHSTTQTSDFNSYSEASPLKTQTFYDGMGRTTETRHFEGGSNYIAVRQRYDSLGRVSQVSNPFRNGETPVWTTTAYDELSRVLSVTTPDNAVASNSYSGSSATATDQTGKKKRSVSDAFGRVIQIYEDPNGVNWLTSYTYDVQDNLTAVSQYDPVSQVTQTRNFTYDSLKRLLSATKPENGTVNNVYDTQGNVLVQTDARGVSKHYAYDAVNRLTRRWYNGSASTSATLNNSPALPANVGTSEEVNLFYDSQGLPAGAPPSFSRGYATGRLVAVTYGSTGSGDYFSFDALGRTVLKVQQTGGVNYQMTIGYNNGGAQKSLTYPSGHVVNYNYDQAGRLGDQDAQHLAMTGNIGDGVTRTYTASITYDEWSGLSRERFGTDTPLYHKEHRNVRGQLYDMRLSTINDDSNWNRGAIVNYYSFQPFAFGSSGPDNNGNLLIQQHYVPTDDAISSYSLMQQNYDYDALNRLKWMSEYRNASVNTGGQDYSYDRYGNRTMSGWGTGINNQQFVIDKNSNRLGVPSGQSGVMQYDAAGNLTNDTYSGAGTRTYDAENRMVSATNSGSQQSIYTYDADGKRVRRNSYNQETRQVYGMDGELLAEYAANSTPSSPQKEYGYRNGELLITATAPNRTNVASATNGGVALASSTTPDSEFPGMTFPPSSVIDGDHRGLNWEHGGGWRDGTNTFPDWLEVDFSGNKSIDEIDVFSLQDNYSNPVEPTEAQTFSLNGVTDFDVQYWNGASWVTVPGGSVTGNNKVWRKFSFTSITTNKVRVLVNNALNNRSRLVELEAWGTTALTNVALASNGGVASASSTTPDSEFPGYELHASSANDGDRAGLTYPHNAFWRDGTNNSYPDWLQIAFSGSKTISEIDVFTLQDDIDTVSPSQPTETMTFTQSGITDFEVQYWNGTSWMGVPGASVAGNNKVWRKFTFSAITTDKVRVLVNNALNTRSRIVELEAWQGAEGSSSNNSAEVQWIVSDQLGTPRMIADKTGSLTGVSRHDYLPFGEELFAGTGGRTTAQGYSHSEGVRQHFTGYERDNETGLDYAHARYYANTQGRFTGVDPVSGNVGNPQTWNGYTYTLNNPVNLTDPTGMFANAEYGSDPSREMDPFLDYAKKRALWEDELERALAAYQQMVDQGLANLKQRQQKKKQQQPQVVDITKDKTINQQVAQINKAAKPLAQGEAAVPTNAQYIIGDQVQLHNATVDLPDGTQLAVADGYMRAVAVVITDQGGNIMNNPNLTVTEKVTPTDANAKALEAAGKLITSNNIPVQQASNGVFYDAQIRVGTSRNTYQTTQDVTIKSGRTALFRIQGNQITVDDTTRSITIKQGQLRRFH